jgi:hypothetical protein
VKGKLKAHVKYRCPVCSGVIVQKTVECKEVMLEGVGKLDCVDRFCYLGDVIGDGGGVEEASIARVRCAWGKFMELAPLLTARRVSLRLKGKIYRSCVQRVLVYASETWATKVADMQRLERTERNMVRWMCGVTVRQERSIHELMKCLGVEDVATVVRRGRLRWFGHVERKQRDDWMSKCRELVVEGSRERGRRRKTWRECIEEDMKRMKLIKLDAQDRGLWRRALYGKRLTSASAEKVT